MIRVRRSNSCDEDLRYGLSLDACIAAATRMRDISGLEASKVEIQFGSNLVLVNILVILRYLG